MDAKKTPTRRRKIAEAPPKYKTGYKTKPSILAERISFSKAKITAFCKRWQISEFSLFGSVLRDDFTPESDVDVLVNFHQQAKWSLWDLMDMTEELEKMFGRKVDLVEKEAIRNPYRRHSILNGSQVFYAAK
jgi:predicted nucleotidyltransferase